MSSLHEKSLEHASVRWEGRSRPAAGCPYAEMYTELLFNSKNLNQRSTLPTVDHYRRSTGDPATRLTTTDQLRLHLVEASNYVLGGPEMPIHRLNHAVLYVRNVERSAAFYADVLGFRTITDIPGKAAFMLAPGSTNDHDLGLFQIGDGARPSDAGRATVGLYHLAWEVDTLAELKRLRDVLSASGSLVGATDHSTTKALYAKDPDGLEFEVCWIVPAELLTDDVLSGRVRMAPLDLDAEIARYGADTRGGLGNSVPAAR